MNNKEYIPKLDADDQEAMAQAQAEGIKAALTPTPKWEKSPSEIASDIADQFYQVASLFHADLRRQIISAIEEERSVTLHYMTQMGRWWERLGS